MLLGGCLGDLMDQVKDGVVDLLMIVVGYIFGCFLCIEVFEFLFMMINFVVILLVFQQMVDEDFQDNEYLDVKVFGVWVYGFGVIYLIDLIEKLEDMKGKILCGLICVINDMLLELGVEFVGMFVFVILEVMFKGVINGIVILWEVMLVLCLLELVGYYIEFIGFEVFYIVMIVLVMNKDKYNVLFDDLCVIFDVELGVKFFEFVL